jgi:hypothetical protein
MALSNEDKKDVRVAFGKKAANAVSRVTNDARNKAIHAKMGDEPAPKKKRGNYSIFSYEAGGAYGEHPNRKRLAHNLTYGEMHHELKTNPAYRGTDTHGFHGGRTYPRKK